MSHDQSGRSRSVVPDAEIDIDLDLVRSLLNAQHPDLAARPLEFHAEGWDNVTVRCGSDLAIRLPRRSLGAEIISVELRWLPVIAPHLPVAVPAAISAGEPTDRYPWHWGVVPWIEGDEATPDALAPAAATRVGRILRALHDVSLPTKPPRNRFRGGPLDERAEAATARIGRLARSSDSLADHTEALRRVFDEGLRTSRDVDETWLHADLHPRNVLTSDGDLAGVIDWGDMCAGDPCTDLAAAWMLFDPDHHDAVWKAYRPTAPTLARARAWTVAYGLMLLEAGTGDDPGLAHAGRTALERVLR